MKPIILLAIPVFAVALYACKNDSKQAANAVAAETALPAPPPSPKPEMYLYWVGVDKLNLRDQPSKKGKVIVQFEEGDFVEGAGEVSANKEEATLRNIPYNEPYFKVTSTTPEQHNGWAYSAALVPIYAGPRATAPDLGKLSEFSMFLVSLDVKKLESGKKAWAYVSQHLSDVQGTLADGTFILLEHFLFRMETEGDFYAMTEAINWQESDYSAVDKGTFDVNKYPVTKSIAENGFRLESGEGSIFPVVDWSKLGAAFASRMTPPMKNYLEQSIQDQKNKMWEDGGIIIPIQQVADRAIWWEKFNQANPYFVRGEETKAIQRSLVTSVLFGANNTPAFGGENEPVTEEFKKAWDYVLQKYPGTELGKVVKELSNLVAAEGGKNTKKVAEFMQRYTTE